jgi:F0F1-type ATP synthase assembly protein I
MATRQETQQPLGHAYPSGHQYQSLLVISAWGFVIAISSFLFLYVGYHIDQYFGTAPAFMLGLLFLAVFLCIGRLYREAWLTTKKG